MENDSNLSSTVIVRISKVISQVSVVIMIPSMGLMITADVVMRYIFSRPISGAHDYSSFMMMVLVVLSFSWCWARRGHIRMELVVRNFPRWLNEVCWSFSAAVGTFVWGMMAYYSFIYLQRSFVESEVTVETGLITWPFRLTFFLGIAFFALHMFIDVFRFLWRAIRKEEVKS
jgi:TRAP-type C4-dicarboxylate transport system permease small subunit